MYYYNMKTICDWNNCFELGEYRAPVEKDNSKTIDFFALSMSKNLIRTGIILQECQMFRL